MTAYLDKSVIMISQDIDDIPFDIRHLRRIKYGDSPAGLEKLSKDLDDAIKKMLHKKLTIIKARYGTDDKGKVVTSTVRAYVRNNNTLDLHVSNDTFDNDPAPGEKKFLELEYLLNGQIYTKEVEEDRWLRLPEGG